jgi:hypothetical protein
MNCDWLQDATAYSCVPVRGLHSEPGIEIGTPFSFADGSAIVLYAMSEGDKLLLSDNGEMLAHLAAVGIRLERRMPMLRDRLAPFGLHLTDDGDVRTLVPVEQGRHMLHMMISGMLSISEWEREQLGLDETTQDLAAEAELLLRAWKPHSHLELRPKIKGQSRREHVFAFLLDGEYIDVIPANHTATGNAMRKAGDVKNSPDLAGREIRVVVDDRKDPARADVERSILGSIVKAMHLSKLQALARAGGPIH